MSDADRNRRSTATPRGANGRNGNRNHRPSHLSGQLVSPSTSTPAILGRTTTASSSAPPEVGDGEASENYNHQASPMPGWVLVNGLWWYHGSDGWWYYLGADGDAHRWPEEDEHHGTEAPNTVGNVVNSDESRTRIWDQRSARYSMRPNPGSAYTYMNIDSTQGGTDIDQREERLIPDMENQILNGEDPWSSINGGRGQDLAHIGNRQGEAPQAVYPPSLEFDSDDVDDAVEPNPGT